MARPSLRRRLLALILGLTAVAWLAVGISAYVQVRHEARELIEEHEAREEIVEALGDALVWPLAAALPALADAGITVADVGIRRPTLDDVFLRLTGHRAEDSVEVAA